MSAWRTIGAILVALMLIGAAGAVNAGLVEDGLAAYKAGNYAAAAELFRRAGYAGDAGAQYALGVMYLQGQGVPENPSSAAKWLQMSAEQGYANAQYIFGVLCANGNGVKRSRAVAIKWLRAAADQGHAKARDALARYAPGELGAGTQGGAPATLGSGLSPRCDAMFRYYKTHGGVAFAASSDGQNCGWAQCPEGTVGGCPGNWFNLALNACRSDGGRDCRIYAIDDEVKW